ncbi:MAG: MerR family transcriptional regulator [Candidatus Omnitrophota bacterium]|nr:MerR family transcriptional regulator [Candidatus Omnitrophota bacterium]
MRSYRISEVIRVLGISRKTYYIWENTGKIPKARREPISGYRYWTAEDLRKLKKIVKKLGKYNREKVL